MNMITSTFLLSVTVISAVTDIKKRVIPNRIIFPAIVLALLLQCLNAKWNSIYVATVGCALLSIVYYITDKFLGDGVNFLGGGDIKLLIFMMLMIGDAIFEIIFYASITIFPIALYYWIKEKRVGEKQKIPFALNVLLGLLLYLR